MNLSKIKKIVLGFVKFVGVFLVVFILYVCFVPPFGQVPRAEHFRVEKLDPQENALTEYNLAMKSLESVTQRTHPTINSDMEKASRGFIAVDDKLTAFLTEHQDAIEHLKEAAKCSNYQFYDHSPVFSDPSPSYLESTTLFNLTGLQGRVFIDQGKLAKAAEINLAAYKMANYFAMEPNGSLVFSLITEVNKGRVLVNLFYLLKQDEITRETLLEIAKKIQQTDDNLPDPYEVMLREWRMTQLSLDSILIGQKGSLSLFNNNKKIDYLPAALKLRLYQSYMEKSQSHILLLTSPLKQWDFEGLKVAQELSRNMSEPLLNKTWVDFTGLFDLVSVSTSPTLSSLYIGRATSAAVKAFALCGAYQKKHGKFPDTLAQAVDDLGVNSGLKVPIDPSTGQPMGYRLQDGKPMVWFIGKDGQDDGGKRLYTRDEIHSNKPGIDIVFAYGELPFWVKAK